MSHLSMSLKNRLDQTESAVFELWMLYLRRISFQIIWCSHCICNLRDFYVEVLGETMVECLYTIMLIRCNSVVANRESEKKNNNFYMI